MVLAVLDRANPFDIDVTVVHIEVAGAGCADGVTGSPWKNVDVPYTPIGCPSAFPNMSKVLTLCTNMMRAQAARTSPESPMHWSNDPSE